MEKFNIKIPTVDELKRIRGILLPQKYDRALFVYSETLLLRWIIINDKLKDLPFEIPKYLYWRILYILCSIDPTKLSTLEYNEDNMTWAKEVCERVSAEQKEHAPNPKLNSLLYINDDIKRDSLKMNSLAITELYSELYAKRNLRSYFCDKHDSIVQSIIDGTILEYFKRNPFNNQYLFNICTEIEPMILLNADSDRLTGVDKLVDPEFKMALSFCEAVEKQSEVFGHDTYGIIRAKSAESFNRLNNLDNPIEDKYDLFGGNPYCKKLLSFHEIYGKGR